MTIGAKIFLGAFVLTIIACLWVFRIDAKRESDGSAMVIDRWTGHVYWCAVLGGPCRQFYPPT
jgi:hypothetical protein